MTSLTGLKRKIDYSDCPEYTDIMLAIAYAVFKYANTNDNDKLISYDEYLSFIDRQKYLLESHKDYECGMQLFKFFFAKADKISLNQMRYTYFEPYIQNVLDDDIMKEIYIRLDIIFMESYPIRKYEDYLFHLKEALNQHTNIEEGLANFKTIFEHFSKDEVSAEELIVYLKKNIIQN